MLTLVTTLVFFDMSQAAVIGLKKNTIKYGLVSHAGWFSVKDPQGQTNYEFKTQPVNILVSDWLKGGKRYNAELYYFTASLKSKPDSVGQQLNQFGVRTALLYDLTEFKYLKPWFGIGFDLSYTEYSKRHIIDDDGFLLKKYNNRNTLNAALLFQLVNEWQLERNWDLGLKTQYMLPLTDSVNSVTFAIYLLYRGF